MRCCAFNVIFRLRAATASAASPSVPETQISSPTHAPSRRKALPAGTSPMICTHKFSGPHVVSPPIKSTSCARASRIKPRENAASHFSSALGKANASVAQRGVAPIAARSDKFTASVLWPSASPSAPLKKCRPSTSISTEIASTCPRRGRISAASSPTPNSVCRVRWVKYLSIRLNSPRTAVGN